MIDIVLHGVLGTLILLLYLLPIAMLFTQWGDVVFSGFPDKWRCRVSLFLGCMGMVISGAFYSWLEYHERFSWRDAYKRGSEEQWVWFFSSAQYWISALVVFFLIAVLFTAYTYRKYLARNEADLAGRGRCLCFFAVLDEKVQKICAFVRSGKAMVILYFYMVFSLGTLPGYRYAFDTLNDMQLHTPIASEYSLWFYVLIALGVIAYIRLRCAILRLPPLQSVGLLVLLLLGIVVSGALLYQLSDRLLSFERLGKHSDYWGSFQAKYSMTFLLTLFPLFYIGGSLRLLKTLVTEPSLSLPIADYHSPWQQRLAALLADSRRWPFAALLCLLPLFLAAWALLQIFGQQPEAALRVFTETSDWTLSQKISPRTVEYRGHYLCTVAAFGHARLVKPLRWGVRYGNPIIVNRQLLIANAFEDLLMEHFPKTHHRIRALYDRYGYPLSKHIQNPWSSDVVFVLMKPVEWLFLAALYAFDRFPEQRIARQYTLNADCKGRETAKTAKT